MAVVATSENYPYDQPYWNVHDQNYWIDMNGFGFPTSGMLDKYAYIIEQGKQDVFEQEYEEYIAENPPQYPYY
jgi:hypothetical protein